LSKRRSTGQRARSLKSRRAENDAVSAAWVRDQLAALHREPIKPWDTSDNPAPRPLRFTERMSSAERKMYPITSGLIDYFPDACAVVANVSWIGNEKHNPGEPMHHARGKSMDHADCIARHLLERGGYDTVLINGVEHRIRHTAALAWRSFALLQEELEAELALPLPRNAKV
jgi:hypothetical protein